MDVRPLLSLGAFIFKRGLLGWTLNWLLLCIPVSVSVPSDPKRFINTRVDRFI